MSTRAQEEVNRRRESYAKRKSTGAFSSFKRTRNDGVSDASTEKWRQFFQVVALAVVLFWGGYFLTGSVSTVEGKFLNGPLITTSGPISIPNAGALYRFSVSPNMPNAIPAYSEFEVELLDSKKNHVYSFYKDLWIEQYLEDGRKRTYSDKKMSFDIELQEAGDYYLRAFSHKNGVGGFKYEVGQVNAGSLYFNIYGWVFLALLGLSYFTEIWNDWEKAVKVDIKGILKNKVAFFTLLFVCSAFAMCVYFSLTHYGYAGAGGYDHEPSYFFPNKNVYYLG